MRVSINRESLEVARMAEHSALGTREPLWRGSGPQEGQAASPAQLTKETVDTIAAKTQPGSDLLRVPKARKSRCEAK